MTEYGWIESTAIVLGGFSAVMVLWIGRGRVLGSQTRLTLAVCLIAPIILILGMEKILNSEAIAAIVGALVGTGSAGGAVSDGEGTSANTRKPK